MTLLVVRLYFETAILVTAGLGLSAGAFTLASRLAGRQSARPWLALARVLLVTSVVLPIAVRAVIGSHASGSFHPGSGEALRLVQPVLIGVSPAAAARVVRPAAALGEGTITILAVVFITASALGLFRLLRDFRRSWRLCRTATVIRRRGRLRVCLSERMTVPISAWTVGSDYVVLPVHLLLEPGHLRVTLAHELAHIRGRDTVWVLVPALLRALVPWHPAAALWVRWLARLEELACDERVLDRRAISPMAYGECLLWVAEAAVVASSRPAVVALPMLGRSTTFLERRIAMLFVPPAPKRFALVAFAGTAALMALAVTSALARDAIGDRRLRAADVQSIAEDLAHKTGFHVIADESVVDEINLVIGRADARARFREGLERLAAYRPTGGEVLRRNKLPLELLAIPQTESRVQPLPEAMNRMRSAGIWQFIPATARRYGLRVDETTDERMDPVRSAEAAAALLNDLYAEFQDWRLAVAAYNAGSEKVRRAIAENGTNDPVALVKAGAISRYSSAVMAAALLIHRPDLVD